MTDIINFETQKRLRDIKKYIYVFKSGELDDSKWKRYMDEAYYWFESLLMEFAVEKPRQITLTDLKEHGDYQKDEGFFLSPKRDKMFYRIFNPESWHSSYFQVLNYRQIENDEEELFYSYIRAGVFQYLEREKPEYIKSAFTI